MQAYMGGSLITNSNIQKNYPAIQRWNWMGKLPRQLDELNIMLWEF